MSTEIIKKQAKLAGAYLKSEGIDLQHSKCLHLIAAIHNVKNWQTFKPMLEKQATDSPWLEQAVGKEEENTPLALIQRYLHDVNGWRKTIEDVDVLNYGVAYYEKFPEYRLVSYVEMEPSRDFFEPWHMPTNANRIGQHELGLTKVALKYHSTVLTSVDLINVEHKRLFAVPHYIYPGFSHGKIEGCKLNLREELPTDYKIYQDQYVLINEDPSEFYYVQSNNVIGRVLIDYPQQFTQVLQDIKGKVANKTVIHLTPLQITALITSSRENHRAHFEAIISKSSMESKVACILDSSDLASNISLNSYLIGLERFLNFNSKEFEIILIE